MKQLLLIIATFTYCATSNAQNNYTLEKCIEIGLEKNYSIRIVQNEEKIASNNMTPGNAGYLPSADLSGGFSGSVYDYNYNYTDGTSEKVNGVNSETANVGINLNWTVFDGFGIQANYNRLKELEQMGKINTRLSIENLVTNITAEYYNYIRQRIRLSNLRYTVNLSKERLRIVEAWYIVGSFSNLDLQQATVYFNADSSQLIRQYETVNSSLIRLNELMGIEPVNSAINVLDTVPLNILLSEADLWQKTLSNNASLLVSQKNKTLSEIEYKRIQSRNYPYMRLNAGYGYSTNWYSTGSTDLQKRLGLNYGVTVGMTLFDGMNRKREQKNARIQIENNELRVKDMELMLKADLSNLWMAYRNNLELWNLEKENSLVAQDNYKIAIERYKLGNLAGIELREAQNNLLEAEERRSIAEYNTKLCEISLMQLSGQILNYLNP
jgi:Outer membrane protein